MGDKVSKLKIQKVEEDGFDPNKETFYRYECWCKGLPDWVGIGSCLSFEEDKMLSKYIDAPSWYKKNPGKDSRCYLTEKGFKKYNYVFENIIESMSDRWSKSDIKGAKIRLIRANNIGKIVSRGKIQVIAIEE